MPPFPQAAQVVRDRGERGRVVRYTSQDGRRVFAKLYPTAAEADRCVQVLTALQREGFHDDARHRVPAVLEHRRREQVVVLAEASGDSLASLIRDQQGPTGEARKEPWLEGVRGAARWLAALHDTPVSVCRSTDVARPPLTRLNSRRDVLAAARPELATETADLLRVLDDRAPLHTHAVDRTTHGRYHPDHVFLEPDAAVVTGIDLDRATPGDPARDLGEFVHRARALVARAHRGASSGADQGPADRATGIFLAEYQRRRGGRDLTTLAYHWSFAVLWHLFGSMGKHRSESSLDRYRAEFAAVPRLVDELG